MPETPQQKYQRLQHEIRQLAEEVNSIKVLRLLAIIINNYYSNLYSIPVHMRCQDLMNNKIWDTF